MKIFACLIVAALLFGCKKPVSEFQLKKYEYSQGDALEYENFSENSKSSKWVVFNSDRDTIQSIQGKNPIIVTGIMAPDGVYSVQLTSSKKNDRKPSVSEKQFLLKCERQYLTVNSGTSGNGGGGTEKEYSVYIDNQYIGDSQSFSGVFQKKIPNGLRLVKLISANKIHEEVINFDSNGNWEYITF